MRHIPVWVLMFVTAAGLSAQAPVVFDGGVLNGASFAKDTAGKGQPVSVGSLVSIFGTNLAARTQSFSSVPISTSLGGVTVTFNNVPAPVRDLLPQAGSGFDQLNVQVPWNAATAGAPATVNVVVTRDGVASAPQAVRITPFSPAVYSIPPGVGNAVAVNPDGSIAAPAGAIPGFPTRPARRGESLFMYASGLGTVDSPPANGADSLDRLRLTSTPPQVLVDGMSALSVAAALAPQFPGVYQVNFTIPPNVTSGDKVTLQISLGGTTSTNQVTIAIAP